MSTTSFKIGRLALLLLLLGSNIALWPQSPAFAIDAADPNGAATPSRPSDDDLRQADWIAAGRAKFISACAYCHGSKGDAGKVKSFTEREKWDPQFIHDTIVNGRTRGANVMPPWGGSIADDQIWRIVAYIKSLSLDFKGPIDSSATK